MSRILCAFFVFWICLVPSMVNAAGFDTGIPYDCLFLEDLADNKTLERYDILIFGQCNYVEETAYQNLKSALQKYLAAGGNLIIDGPLATADEQARDRRHADLDSLLGIEYAGFKGNSDFRIKVADNSHYITTRFEKNQFITQHLANGLNIVQFKSDGRALLISSDEKRTHPFLSCSSASKNRIVLVSDFSTWAGAASFFRNVQPQVFYANQLFNVMIRTVQWAIYGDLDTPFPAPQVSNANLTAIVRLDADNSNNLDAQIKTINYLIDLAKQSGVVPVYAWVSSNATKAGWQDLAPWGKKIEEVGGEIGTHSKFHRINKEMTPARWEEELGGSIQEIEFNMADYDFPIGKVEWFINPGNTIQMKDYEEIARRFSFYMTHGFEQDMPLGYGNLTWYTGPHKNLVVLENVPSPDYQWFNDPTWSYTTAQITAYEEAIFDHMFNNIGRGVIFNEMWHDYSITAQPQSKKDRIVNESTIAFYDAMKTKFTTHKIYCPTPEDLGHKLRAMAQWNYSWRSERNQIEMELDLSGVLLDTIPHFTGGMGVKIENTSDRIQKVTINGKPHFAFDEQVIILPNLKKGVNKIVATLGPHASPEARLTYISKRMPAIEQKGETIEVQVISKTTARCSFFAPKAAVVLNADWQEWNRAGERMLNASVTSDRKIILKKIDGGEFALTRAAARIVDYKGESSSVTLTLQANAQPEAAICFRSSKAPKSVMLGNQKLESVKSERDYCVKLPDFTGQADLAIGF
ncbi:hypothetical protein DCC62_11645 [candidate division KSB1 bacterium]|nr:MAG: hypothetical protein DCC62_11645 [candidate division KSB1 bacterium]